MPGVWYGDGVAGQAEKRVTRGVGLAAVYDLLARPPRATVTFVARGAVEIVPAVARFTDGTHLFGVRTDGTPNLARREVVLVIDDGPYWFQLRGISVRGVATRVEPPGEQDERRQVAWYAIEPRRILAWDYGAIREE